MWCTQQTTPLCDHLISSGDGDGRRRRRWWRPFCCPVSLHLSPAIQCAWGFHLEHFDDEQQPESCATAPLPPTKHLAGGWQLSLSLFMTNKLDYKLSTVTFQCRWGIKVGQKSLLQPLTDNCSLLALNTVVLLLFRLVGHAHTVQCICGLD